MMRKYKSGWRNDLQMFFRSTWEANYARYLNFLVERNQILGWEYESIEFYFPIKRGTRFYRPDFLVFELTGEIVIHEVKGHMTQKANTALTRMAKYYPGITLNLIDRSHYKSIAKYQRLISEWE